MALHHVAADDCGVATAECIGHAQALAGGGRVVDERHLDFEASRFHAATRFDEGLLQLMSIKLNGRSDAHPPINMESSMRTILLAAVALALTGCAAMRDEDHAAHHPAGAAAASASDRTDKQMKMMQEMHRKMMAAKTPEERQALMAEHMKAMQGGMSMMCEMDAGGMGTQGGSGSNDMMKRCMDMKDMTMQMMMDREPGKPPAAK